MKRALVERVFERALEELDVGDCVGAALGRRPAAPVRVVAVGKAAPAMAAGMIRLWGGSIERCLVVVPDHTELVALHRAARRAHLDEALVVMRAGHPLPDARSVRAGRACLETFAGAERRELLVLVSGGASALACVPSPGITLATKRAVTRAMLSSGASVQEINVVRKHLSGIKGGGLLRAAGANRLRTLVASDVIGGSVSDVGSGPSVPDASTVVEARRLLRRFAPSFAEVPLARTCSAAGAGARRVRAKIIVSPEDLARATAIRLRKRGLQVRVLPPSQASVEEVAAEYVALARRHEARVFVRAAEPAVTVAPRAGRGGRSSHLAALVGCGLASSERAVLFGAFASDGVDGQSGTAGAIVDPSFASRAAARFGSKGLERALARFDTGPLHRALGTALTARPTGHNLADLHVLVIA